MAGTNVTGVNDQAVCQNVQNGYKNDSFIASNFGAYQNSNWATCQKSGAQCGLDFNAPQNPIAYTTETCEQGSVSSYYVDVALPEDVMAVFQFAKNHSVPLVIKNSGHDYKGRSSAPFSLAMWTNHLTGITRDKNFVPAGCKESFDGVTYGAGQNFLSLYQFAQANNITIVGGSSETVGAGGGWIQGGGHSLLSNQLGLGVDRALQFKVVTPQGKYLTVSACQNQDLFFALRGGGGSTFGVVMEATTTAAPAKSSRAISLKYASTNLDTNAQFLDVLIANMPRWGKEGWGGYIGLAAETAQTAGLVLFTSLLTLDEAIASMQPVTSFASNIFLGNVVISSAIMDYPTFLDAYTAVIVPVEEVVGIGGAISSHLIPAVNFSPGTNATNLRNAINNGIQIIGGNAAYAASIPQKGIVYGGISTQILVTTPLNFNLTGIAASAVTPAWRSALWHVVYFDTFNYNAPPPPATIAAAFERVTKAADFLRAISAPGAYQNEADVHEPDHEESFWGIENYDRLVKIKQQYDPDSLLECWMCIGWNSTQATSNPRYDCYV